MVLFAFVIATCERCVQRSQNVPSLAPQPPLPRAFPCASLALTAPPWRRSVPELSLLWPAVPEQLGSLRIENSNILESMWARGPLVALPWGPHPSTGPTGRRVWRHLGDE